jgi:hypothetical protein
VPSDAAAAARGLEEEQRLAAARERQRAEAAQAAEAQFEQDSLEAALSEQRQLLSDAMQAARAVEGRRLAGIWLSVWVNEELQCCVCGAIRREMADIERSRELERVLVRMAEEKKLEELRSFHTQRTATLIKQAVIAAIDEELLSTVSDTVGMQADAERAILVYWPGEMQSYAAYIVDEAPSYNRKRRYELVCVNCD